MFSVLSNLRNSVANAGKDETGAMSVLNLYFVIALCIFGGIGIDTANLFAARSQLQVAADVAAHAALYSRGSMDADAAKAEAVTIAQANMPTGRYGDVLRAENIHFGTYDQSTKVFSIDESSTAAVWVETDRLSENANPVSSFLLHFVGFWDFDVVTNAVFVAGAGAPCLGDGWFAKGRIDMQSNNGFYNGFCIHSDTRIEFNQNNFFEHDDGVIVSAPRAGSGPDYRGNLITPGGSWGNNTGLEHAWQPADKATTVNVDTLINQIMTGMTDPTSDHFRSFVTNTNVVNMAAPKGKGKKAGGMTPGSMQSGRVHNVSCGSEEDEMSMGAGTYSNVVMITNCRLSMANGVKFEDSTIISTSKSSKGVLKSPQGFTLGKNDSCATGGGAQLILMGSMKTAAKMQLYGGQIIAAGDVKFAAQGNGFAGASIIAGGEIDGTSNSTMGLCQDDDGKEDFFKFDVGGPPRLAG
ncbi:MAG: pilus assembly protein TadG-related protein [Paracoccaceae bacterium]|nr:pilus assembly protein TadG-related protein [Paracoccaceae bacterium]